MTAGSLVAAAIVLAAIGVAVALRGDAAAGVVFIGLAVVIVCTVLRLHIRKGAR